MTIWDTTLRATALVGAIAIPVALMIPQSAPLIGFALVTIWINGPISFLFPAMYEPILIGFGSVYPPTLVATLGVCATVVVEFLNYHLYQRFVTTPRLTQSGIGRAVVRWFDQAPFVTVIACSSVLPYWPLRFVAPLAGYPVRRYLTATAFGRFPRLWFFASIGSVWVINPRVLVAIAAVGFAIAFLRWVWRLHGRQT